ncbi:MAG: hypothetical protein JRE20_13250 [Deltaproteobacteria bacterium]|nr:hypothetical protein [Deltaproteobacteria bacterium]
MRQCDQEKNLQHCTCTYEPCSKKGICCECIAYHRSSGELPGCLFPKDVEKTYDRSIEGFVKTFQERGRW